MEDPPERLLPPPLELPERLLPPLYPPPLERELLEDEYPVLERVLLEFEYPVLLEVLER